MESQLPRSHGHHYEQEPYNTAGHQTVAEGHEDEQHHEKKSVLGKVKAKAKKIKSKLTSHGHNHDHEHEEEEEEDYESDEEIVADPEIHGAPIYNSASVTAPPTTPSWIPEGNLEKPSLIKEDRYESIISEPPVRSFAQWQEESSGGKLGSSTTAEAVGRPEDKHVSFSSDKSIEGRGENLGHSGVGIGGLMDMEEDPPKDRINGAGFNPSNYQTKVADPTGAGEEIGVTPILHSFDKMGINDETQQKQKPETEKNIYSTGPTGSHNQFSPEPTAADTSITNPHKSIDSRAAESSPLDHNRLSENPKSSYTEMVSAAAYTVANKAATAKNAVASTMGYGRKETETSTRDSHEEGIESNKSPAGGGTTDYVHKIASTVTEKLAPVYEKVAGAGSTVMPKMGQPDKGGVSVKEYWMEKLRPGDEDKAFSEVISGVFTTQKGKEGGGDQREVGDGSRGICEVVSDVIQKRAPDEKDERGEEETRRGGRRIGKVTESKAVEERLGIVGDSGEGVGGGVGVGKGVVDTIRGTVSSWLGKGSESQTSQDGNEGSAGGGAAREHGQDDHGRTTPQDMHN